ncbi:sodium/potassium-transporting ATPase subunit beta-2 isoform X2 [Condylostylus longicornis]|uniref:sodium/potassium-transporting ATPase subunit beta-2 isoform X2 n=1 Tax=Condylostylus longicornis TaxID=2530218 RepID=UPI00244DBA94|nr:sodium/potassium-transporting ATPase subunit beta-2 isoform X2 [Condylostylus longicornis]XP_055382095.1 sodium/potassium-transporting ATPase subunit beta-2 isoform X2 [Condylostylus longicornis]XP_055382096.1 sodium/potassium-transporting ATPase subunit beta-2 isoform X2 [Condylostylus longicornis]XP_055382098.1 sodium/potassium-transporting ATPase subunit beta-2 isoform X2 [Condylostylus longicornis]XP_055382099.1 sodium/potassium-transporting ATPase subunit beta-2 isoform X2 [Condylostylu
MSKAYHSPSAPQDDQFFVRQKPQPFNLSRFIYNKAEGTYLGRNGTSWAKIGIFYTVFYGVLAALVAICMWAFFQTLDPRRPKWTLESSLIGTNPGLGFRPQPPEENIESTLIWYKGTEYENYKHWTDSLTEFLGVYKTPGMTAGKGQNIFNCNYNQLPPLGQVCDVDIKSWEPCTHENNYSYHKSSPCVFLKLNKIFGWIPEFYNNSKDLPSNMPNNLKEYIADMEKTQKEKMNTIWVSCEGENPSDQEYIGPVDYIPIRGFPGYYYPYLNSEGYLSPLVAVHFQRPKRGIIINIECKAWARNIIHDRKDRIGSVHFELLID